MKKQIGGRRRQLREAWKDRRTSTGVHWDPFGGRETVGVKRCAGGGKFRNHSLIGVRGLQCHNPQRDMERKHIGREVKERGYWWQRGHAPLILHYCEVYRDKPVRRKHPGRQSTSSPLGATAKRGERG